MKPKEHELSLKQLALALLHTKEMRFKNNSLIFSINVKGATK